MQENSLSVRIWTLWSVLEDPFGFGERSRTRKRGDVGVILYHRHVDREFGEKGQV
jgi:hypothetical protein